MLDADDLVLSLVDLCGEQTEFGRTSLQKLAYLSIAALRWPRVGHTAHFYGPYSRGLERTVVRLVHDGNLKEESESLGFVGNTGFPAKRFHYQLTQAGEDRIGALRESNPDDLSQLQKLVGKVRLIVGSYDPHVLSLAAKVHYIVEQSGGEASHEQISESAREFGWRISPRQIDQVAKILQALSLLRRESPASTKK